MIGQCSVIFFIPHWLKCAACKIHKRIYTIEIFTYKITYAKNNMVSTIFKVKVSVKVNNLNSLL